MATESPEKQTIHGDPEVKPRFGPGSDEANTTGNPSDPRGDVASGDSSDPRDEKFLTDDQLSQKEKSADTSGSTDGSREKDSLFTGEENPGRMSRFGKKFRVNARKKITIGIVAGVLGFGGIGAFSIVQGPLKIIHLGELLNLPSRSQDGLNARRLGGLYRYIRTDSFGETRLGKLESIMNKKILTGFEKQGIKMSYDGRGRLSKVSVDPRENSQLKNAPVDERRALVAESFGTTPDKIRVLGKGLMEVDTFDTKVDTKRKLISKSFDLAGKGRISKAVNNRIVTRFFGEFSRFHPMKRAEQAAIKKLDTAKAARAKRKADQAKANTDATKLSPEAEKLVADTKNKLGLGKSLKVAGIGALSITGTLCMIKDVADTLPILQFLASVEPAMKGAYTAMSYGSQAKAGNDFNVQQLGDFADTLTDAEGKDVFQAKSLNALGGSNKGVDLDPDIKESFSPQNKAAAVSDAIRSIPGADALCSPLGQLGQVIAGVVLLVATDGAGTAAIKTTTGAISGAITSQIIGFIEKAIIGPSLASKVLAGGPLGGNLLAHGAMSASGMSAMNFGGVAFGALASQDIRDQRIADYENEFTQKDLATRLFDVSDRRSLASSIVDNTTVTPGDSLTSVANILSSRNLFSGLGSIFNSKASAATRGYDWSMPEYGFSSKITDDPKYQDPYENADKFAAFIDGSDYKGRAKICFGANISKEDTGWNAITDSEVNPALGEYQDANCGDESNENWVRVRLFILDTKNMTAFACSEGDDADPDIQKACTDLGVGSTTQTTTTATTASTAPTTAASSTIDLALLAKDSDQILCATGTRDLGVVQSKFTLVSIVPSGNPPKVRLCQLSSIGGQGNNTSGANINGGAVVISPASSAWQKLGEAAKSAGINLVSSSSFRLADSCGGTGNGSNGCASPGKSAHQSGLAIDFDNMGLSVGQKGSTSSCSGRMTWDTDAWRWLKGNAQNFGLFQFSGESWHWDPMYVIGNRCNSTGTATGN